MLCSWRAKSSFCLKKNRQRKSDSTARRKVAFSIAPRLGDLGCFRWSPCFHCEMSWCPLAVSLLVLAPYAAYRSTCRRSESPQQVLPQHCRPHVTVVGTRPRKLVTNPVERNSGNSECQSRHNPTGGTKWCGTSCPHVTLFLGSRSRVVVF